MVNKKGWIRIVEASISIIIIFGVLLFVFQNRVKQVSSQDPSTIIGPLLEEIASNGTLRNEIIVGDPGLAQDDLLNFLSRRITNPNLNYTVRICNLNESLCPLETYPPDAGGEIYTKDRIISASLSETNPNPKILKIYLWFHRN